MSRFIQDDHNDKPVKEPKKEAPIKAGNPGYDYSKILEGRKLPTKGGYV